jgi:LPS-assembly lipoprotein
MTRRIHHPLVPHRRGFLALGGASLLAGCGLRPLYGEGSARVAARSELAAVRIDVIPDRNGQVLRNLLIDRFYAGGGPQPWRFDLTVGVDIAETRTGLRIDDTASRRILTANSRFRLIRRDTGEVASSGTITQTNTFAYQEAQYGVLVARETATRDLLDAVGDQIATRVALYFARET